MESQAVLLDFTVYMLPEQQHVWQCGRLSAPKSQRVTRNMSTFPGGVGGGVPNMAPHSTTAGTGNGAWWGNSPCGRQYTNM